MDRILKGEKEAIPDDHPVIPQLNDLFGEHTFFLDRHGLNIVEPAEAAGSGAQSAKVVNVANWSDSLRRDLLLVQVAANLQGPAAPRRLARVAANLEPSGERRSRT